MVMAGNGMAAIGLIGPGRTPCGSPPLERPLVGLDMGSRLLVLSEAQAR